MRYIRASVEIGDGLLTTRTTRDIGPRTAAGGGGEGDLTLDPPEGPLESSGGAARHVQLAPLNLAAVPGELLDDLEQEDGLVKLWLVIYTI